MIVSVSQEENDRQSDETLIVETPFGESLSNFKLNVMRNNSIDKLWQHLTTRLLYARKDFRYAWNRRNEECRVDWRESLQARIEDIRMWELANNSMGIGWDKYGLRDPEDVSRELDNGKE